jgi:alkylhydroperoxidase/carboxymuconolactone decarboxylase family protein YurZ
LPTFSPPQSALTPQDIQAVSPALASYTQKSISEDLWNRPGLSRRDRSIVTVSALIARIQTIGMLHYFNIALDSGVKASELSEIVTHIAFYSGWPNPAIPDLTWVPSRRGAIASTTHKNGKRSAPSRDRLDSGLLQWTSP